MKTKRHIPLLLEQATPQDIKQMQEFCSENNIGFSFRYARRTSFSTYTPGPDETVPLYYFHLIGNTKAFQNLQNEMGGRLLSCEHAELCNIADMNDSFENELVECLDYMAVSQKVAEKADKQFLKFIMNITDINVLNGLDKYTCYMNQIQKERLKTRKYIVTKKQEALNEELKEEILSLKVNVKELRETHQMNRTEFCKYFGIPYRTVEDWENGNSTCSTYLFKLMKDKLSRDYSN